MKARGPLCTSKTCPEGKKNEMLKGTLGIT